MSISDQWENEILDHIFNNAAAPAVATAWISLHDGAAGETGANEVTGGAYVRKAGAFGVASAGAVANTATLSWTNMPACTVQSVGVWISSTATGGANFIWGGALTTAKVVGAGDTFQITVGNLDVTLE